jgi:hypothetical protein
MRRYFESLRPANVPVIRWVPDGLFLVRVDRAQYRWHKQKPYYEIRFAVLKPKLPRFSPNSLSVSKSIFEGGGA